MANGAKLKAWPSWIANLLLVLGSIFLTVALVEGALQVMRYGEPVRYAVWPPGLEQAVFPDAQDTPGIEPEPHLFAITPMGYRGHPFGNARLRIAAFGGSTTESLYVPEDFTWPRHVERGLTKERGSQVWVGNFGKSGRNTRQHVLDAKYVLPQFSAQVALFLVGVNDLGLIIDMPDIQPMSLEEIQADDYVRQSLAVADTGTRHLRLPSLVATAYRSATDYFADPDAPRVLPHYTTAFYKRYRKLRAERAGFTTRMPELGPMLDEYARNLGAIADLAAAQGVLPVFISQPTLWSAQVPPALDALFWWGAVGGPPSEAGAVYYPPGALDRMMGAYNDRLRLVARQKNLPLIDAAAKLPKDPAYFYDEMHYNEAGSQALGELIARELADMTSARVPGR